MVFCGKELRMGPGRSHHHGRGLHDDGGVLALPDTGLIAAVGQRGWATGSAWQALVITRHVSALEVHLGERAGRKQSTRMGEEQPGFLVAKEAGYY